MPQQTSGDSRDSTGNHLEDAIKIIGGHDYYDVGLSMGIDPTIKLLRGKSRSIPIEKAGGSLLNHRLDFTIRGYHPELSVASIAVVFCGKVYRGAIVSHGLDKTEGIWAADKLRSWMQQWKGASIEVKRNWSERQPMKLEEYFAPFEASADLRNYMIANKISILVEEKPRYYYDEKCFQVNPFTLKQIGFAKALDPYTAFQELSMWIGGVLGGTSPEIVTIKNDKVLIENHGFDNRFSFRGPRIA